MLKELNDDERFVLTLERQSLVDCFEIFEDFACGDGEYNIRLEGHHMTAEGENTTTSIYIDDYIPRRLCLPYIAIRDIKELSWNIIKIIFLKGQIIVTPQG